MSHQQLSAASAWTSSTSPVSPAACNRITALGRLRASYESSEPFVAVMGESSNYMRTLVDELLGNVEPDDVVVRLTGPFPNPVDLMSRIVDSIGFESNDLSRQELENVFKMFLGYQKVHQNRTVLCLEDVHECGDWFYAQIAALVEQELDHEFGLFTLITGQPCLNDLLDESMSAAEVSTVNQRIALAPFTLAETRDHIRGRIESSGTSDIAGVFEFDAITRIHELSHGSQDVIDLLYNASLKLANTNDELPVSSKHVVAAHGSYDKRTLDYSHETRIDQGNTARPKPRHDRPQE